jgi:LPXTG-motif cell wall-anchored protein
MHLHSLIRALAVTAIGATTTLALATPAVAGGPKGDPRGANGTVKVDGPAFSDQIRNEPHVTCQYQIKFFNFDADEHGNIVFAAQPPSGKGIELLRRNNVLISDDRATGGRPDPDETYTFSSTDLNLSGVTAHLRQGYHIKLTIERIGAPGAGKHKVFWLKPCPPSDNNGGGGNGGGNGGNVGHRGGNGGGSSASSGEETGGPTLPITGAPVAVIAGLGVALIAGGAGLLLTRRRLVS